MKSILFFLILLLFSFQLWSQPTFKAGWNTYKTGTIIYELSFDFSYSDTLKLVALDSSVIFVTPDSLVTMKLTFDSHKKETGKVVNYFDEKKMCLKTEEYRGDLIKDIKEWKYDNKHRVVMHLQEDKTNNKSFKKSYEYSVDKKSGDKIMTESAYTNGRIEFYTKFYFNKDSVKYKEVRYNDNNRDIVHIENFAYGENKRLKERSIYFPEWKVTKRFEESEGNYPVKCFAFLPVGIPDKVTMASRMLYLRKVLVKNKALFNDVECHEFEYKFNNRLNCDIVVHTTKVNNGKQVVIRIKERVQ